MGGKGSVSTMNTMRMMSIVQYRLWVGGIFTLGLTPPTRGHTCRNILLMENASVSMTRTSGMESNWLQQPSNTLKLTLHQSASSTHTPFVLGVLVLWPWLVTRTRKFRRWTAGAEPRFRSTYVKICQITQRGCQGI